MKEKTPTPVFSNKFFDNKETSMFMKFISNKDRKSLAEEYNVGSKISNSGKKQKVKEDVPTF